MPSTPPAPPQIHLPDRAAADAESGLQATGRPACGFRRWRWRRRCSARGRTGRLDEFTISPHRLIRALPRLAAAVPGLPLYGAKAAARTLQRRPHAGRYPDILITCGRRMAGYALAMRRRARADGRDMKIVHIQDPRLPPAMFDALVVPRHDRARGPNVLVTTGSLNRLTLADIKTAMMEMPSRWLESTRGMSVAVMLGGDNRRYRISEAMAGRMADRLTEFAGTPGRC